MLFHVTVWFVDLMQKSIARSIGLKFALYLLVTDSKLLFMFEYCWKLCSQVCSWHCTLRVFDIRR